MEDYQFLPLRDVVFNTLRQAILRGELKPGERLMEIRLANQLGVSRTPIREAIRMLELEGLVIMIPRKGAQVAQITEKDLNDVLEVRLGLEELATRFACERIRSEALGDLYRASRKFESLLETDDLQALAKADVEFHDIIYQATDNARLVQLLNNLVARSNREGAIYGIWSKETHREDSGWVFNPPMPYDELRAEVKDALENILVSHKAKNKVMTRNVNRTKKKGGFNEKVELTPRGALHKESVYGKLLRYETIDVTVNGKMTADIVATVSKKEEREALMARLQANGNDPKKAFAGKNAPAKNPIYLDAAHSRMLPPKVKCTRWAVSYKLRKPVDQNLTISKVVDSRIRKLLEQRIEEFGGDVKTAFQNLDMNPIWLNEEKRIPVRTVTIAENFDLSALHDKRDKNGELESPKTPADFVNLRNNHHIAIYLDEEGGYQEKVMTYFEAVERVLEGLPPVDRIFNASLGWKFLFSMKINEMFVFPDKGDGFFPDEIDLTDPKNYRDVSRHLFRVQSLSNKDYRFRHHLETKARKEDDVKELQGVTWKRIKSLDNLKGVVKVRINHLGEIVAVGEE